jgi:hypothetical protein
MLANGMVPRGGTSTGSQINGLAELLGRARAVEPRFVPPALAEKKRAAALYFLLPPVRHCRNMRTRRGAGPAD